MWLNYFYVFIIISILVLFKFVMVVFAHLKWRPQCSGLIFQIAFCTTDDAHKTKHSLRLEMVG